MGNTNSLTADTVDSVADTVDSVSCLLSECGFGHELEKLLTNVDINQLRQYARDHSLKCDEGVDQRFKSPFCIMVATHLTTEACNNIIELSNSLKNPKLPDANRQAVNRILRGLGVAVASLSDVQKCERLNTSLQNLLQELDTLRQPDTVPESDHRRSTAPKSDHRRITGLIVAMVLTSVFLATTEVCTTPTAADQGQCRLELLSAERNGTMLHRYFVHDDLKTDVSDLSDNRAVVDAAYAKLEKYPGETTGQPTATFILGGAGAGKGTATQTVLSTDQDFAAGVRGAVVLNSDDIMATLPGYSSLLALGEISGTPVTSVDAAAIYHDPAKKILNTFIDRVTQDKKSFIFDGTGNTLDTVLGRMRELHRLGYRVHVVVVHAPLADRQKRATGRAVRVGRTVPPEVVQKSHTPAVWEQHLQTMKKDGSVSKYVLIENV
jgi:adenylate kinase family enzyme